MRRILTILTVAGFTLLLAILFSTAPSSAADVLQDNSDSDKPTVARAANTSSTPKVDDEHFVAGTGGELDQYLFRTNGDGYIKFNIPITRYYFSEQNSSVAFDENGLLTSNAVNHLIRKHILPDTATLRLRVWDVDANNTWCPEVDYISVNEEKIYENGYESKLTGANDTWSTPSFQIPISTLKFPRLRGTNGNPPEAVDNEISIQIDADGCTTTDGYPAWAVEVDWGVIEIPSPIRPIIFAHGWTASTTAFSDFERWLEEEGVPSAGQVDLHDGLDLLAETAPLLRDAIDDAIIEFGVDRLNIMAHSKGGLVTRLALRDESVAMHTEHAITFASPHHGTWMANDVFVSDKCLYLEDYGWGEDFIRCVDSGKEFQIDRMREFNYSGCSQQWPWSDWENCTKRWVEQPNVEYYSFAANGDLAVVPLRSTTYPWEADAKPFPVKYSLNGVFDTDSKLDDHNQVIKEKSVFDKAISCLVSPSNCPIKNENSNVAAVTASALAANDYQIILNESGTLNAGADETVGASLDGGTMAIFEAYSDELLTYTLTDPNGQPIGPSEADTNPNITYTSENNGGYYVYQYQISNPTVGDWQNLFLASSETHFVVSNKINSTSQLSYSADQSTYRPGELVTLKASLFDGNTPFTSVAHEGLVTHPDDSTTTLSFYDDGSNGDTTPNDGVYTAQFTASSTNGHALIDLSATKENTMRVIEASIAVASQTAQFQQVTNEYPIDTNGNGLFDSLNLDLSVNIVASGHFEFQGTLIDGSGQPVVTGYFSTRMAGVGPLPTGLQTISLSFDGSQIHQHGVNGPYTLADLMIFDVTESALEVDVNTNVYTTAAYQIEQFERPMIVLADGNEAVIDTDGNGRYDLLRINLNAEVVQSGNYDVNGRLVDPNGGEIAWGKSSFYASSDGTYSIQLEFDGYEIGEHQVNGPYILRDLSIFNTSGTSSAVFGEAYATQAYSVTDFEGGLAKLYLPIINGSQTAKTACAAPPVLLGPANNGNLGTISPLFQWDSGNDPNATTFRMQLATDPAFTQIVTSLWSSGSSGSRDFRFSRNFEPSTTYYWRAWLECDQIDSPYSIVWSFMTGSGGVVLFAPGLISPANGSIMSSEPVSLQWSPVEGAVEYLLRWRQLGVGGYTYSWIDGTEQDIYWLDPSVVYEWWTSARNAYAIGADSEAWQFTSPPTTSLMWAQDIPDGFVKIEVYDGDGKLYTFIEPE